jgi:hypothetical protein
MGENSGNKKSWSTQGQSPTGMMLELLFPPVGFQELSGNLRALHTEQPTFLEEFLRMLNKL